MKKENRLYDLDIMKALTIILVVFGHVIIMFSPKGAIDLLTKSDFLTLVSEFIYMFHMPAFVAIAGAVYFHAKRSRGAYKNQQQFIVNKIIRLVIPYVFFAVAVVLPTLLYTGIENNVGNFLFKNILLFSGPNHLWYAVMIFNVFVLFNLFETKIYSTPFAINLLIFLLIYRAGPGLPAYFQIYNTFAYLLYFYLGYSFQKNLDVLRKFTSSNMYIMAAVLLTFLLFSLKYSVAINANELYIMLLMIGGAVTGTGSLYLVSTKISNTRMGNNNFIRNLARDSYGIYLFHPMLIYLLFYWIKAKTYNPYIVTIVIFFAALSASIFLVRLFRKLHIQILIGEKSPVETKA